MPFRHHKMFVTCHKLRVPVSKSRAVQTVRASNCIESTCNVNITYSFTDVRCVASSNRAAKAMWVSYSSLCGHFTLHLRTCALTARKEHSSMVWQISCLVSIFCWTWHWCLMISRQTEVEIIITNCTTCCNGANLQLNFELCHVKYYSLLQNGFVLVVHTVILDSWFSGKSLLPREVRF